MADLEMDLTDDKINNLETSGSNMYGASDFVGFIFTSILFLMYVLLKSVSMLLIYYSISIFI
jgi:hypothetical protein